MGVQGNTVTTQYNLKIQWPYVKLQFGEAFVESLGGFGEHNVIFLGT